jgi:hypothetical protein
VSPSVGTHASPIIRPPAVGFEANEVGYSVSEPGEEVWVFERGDAGGLGDDGPQAEEVLAAGETVSPHLVLVEATNVLRRLERSKQLERSEAASALLDLPVP